MRWPLKSIPTQTILEFCVPTWGKWDGRPVAAEWVVVRHETNWEPPKLFPNWKYLHTLIHVLFLQFMNHVLTSGALWGTKSIVLWYPALGCFQPAWDFVWLSLIFYWLKPTLPSQCLLVSENLFILPGDVPPVGDIENQWKEPDKTRHVVQIFHFHFYLTFLSEQQLTRFHQQSLSMAVPWLLSTSFLIEQLLRFDYFFITFKLILPCKSQ